MHYCKVYQKQKTQMCQTESRHVPFIRGIAIHNGKNCLAITGCLYVRLGYAIGPAWGLTKQNGIFWELSSRMSSTPTRCQWTRVLFITLFTSASSHTTSVSAVFAPSPACSNGSWTLAPRLLRVVTSSGSKTCLGCQQREWRIRLTQGGCIISTPYLHVIVWSLTLHAGWIQNWRPDRQSCVPEVFDTYQCDSEVCFHVTACYQVRWLKLIQSGGHATQVHWSNHHIALTTPENYTRGLFCKHCT